MTKIYTYVLTVDNGSAPCVPNGLLTLAICKPRIRKSAEPGDLIVGFSGALIANPRTGQGYPKHAVIYAAVVHRKLSWEQYATGGFQDRMDCIYTYSAAAEKFARKVDVVVHTEYDNKETGSDKQKESRSIHGDAYTETDTDGISMRVCRGFRYFGENAIPLSSLGTMGNSWSGSKWC